ncbi:HAMP domain-containing sensor histidine kinase [Oscillatoria amoena NRMC-F 0135]|nr:HAMP domain-containing sensor histidine kinase [Oscillatoria amoena NRMC-F 0135]
MFNVKLRDKLTFFFSLAAAILLLVFGIAIYFFSAQHRKNEFYLRLQKRVDITEKMFLEKESFTPEAYEMIRQQFLNVLPDEVEEVVPLTEDWQDNLKTTYPIQFLESLRLNDEAYFYEGERQGAGRIFHLAGGDYAVIISAVDRVGINVLANLQTILVLAIAVGIAIMALLSHYLSGKILQPISAKIRKANTISAKNLHERLRVFNPDDEIGQLAIAFNRLLDRIDLAFNAQKLFVANASHEIRNPLTTIIGEADLALEKTRAVEEYKEALAHIQDEAERLNRLVNNLLQLSAISSNLHEVKREKVAVNVLVRKAIETYQSMNPECKVRVTLSAHNPTVNGNRNLLQTALVNLLDNASKFSGHAEVNINIAEIDDSVEIAVTDTGVGIPEEDIPKITQPFFRSENVRKIHGTGIGIPLTVRIVELHGGRFSVTSRLNAGTEVKIILPLITSPG